MPNFSQVALGKRLFLFGGLNGGSNVVMVEEYLADQNIWTNKGAQLIESRHGTAGVSVPAHWFNNLSGGCNGIK